MGNKREEANDEATYILEYRKYMVGDYTPKGFQLN